MNELNNIVKCCLVNGIEVSLALHDDSCDGIAYNIAGFAKSGRATVFEDSDGTIQVHLRYNKVDSVETFEGLAHICFQWCENYKDKGYSYGSWAPVFEKFGWIKSVTKTETTWERV